MIVRFAEIPDLGLSINSVLERGSGSDGYTSESGQRTPALHEKGGMTASTMALLLVSKTVLGRPTRRASSRLRSTSRVFYGTSQLMHRTVPVTFNAVIIPSQRGAFVCG